MGRLTGKVAIVTGAASGIGRVTAQIMASEGAKVAVADFNLEGANETVEQIRYSGGEAFSIKVDVTSEEDIQNMINTTNDKYGRIDILHNNAGGTKAKTDKGILGMDVDTWDFALDLNLKGVMLGCKHVIPIMKKNGGGSIINTASMSGIAGDFSSTAYGAAKGGVITLTKYIATQHGKDGIRCNAVAPGLIITPATKDFIPQQIKDLFQSHAAVDRNGKPEDIANAALFLASDESSFVTGQTIQVDGGLGVHNSVFADFLRLEVKI